MKKNVIVIFGKQLSGKSFLSDNIASGYLTPFYISGRAQNLDKDFLFNGFKDETDLIIIDDLKLLEFKTHIYRFFEDEIVVDRQYQKMRLFKTPKLIINIEEEIEVEDILQLDNSILRRCKFINTRIETQTNGFPLFINKEFIPIN